jgi:Lon protease-like protein
MTFLHTRYEDLPEILPIFPLSGVILLPNGRLPLNIFEPRYLSMILDSLASGRMIGMIQPQEKNNESQKEIMSLYETGCVGRIISFDEVEDDRLLIALVGVCRFQVKSEIEGRHGYRRIIPDYQKFKQDMNPKDHLLHFDRAKLFSVLKVYANTLDLNFNWDAIEKAESHELLVSLSMICPFEAREKQAILECDTLTQRAEVLIALLEMSAASGLNHTEAIKQ